MSRLFRNVLLWPSDEGGLRLCVWPPWGPGCQELSWCSARLCVVCRSSRTVPCTSRPPASVLEVAPWMVRWGFPLSTWLELCYRRDLLSVPRWRFCYRLVFELFAAVEDLDACIEKYSHHHFLLRFGPRSVLLENLVEAVLVPDGPIVVYRACLFPAQYLRQI